VIEVEGKSVFTELAELVDPAHTALLLIDMQRDFIDADGVFGKLGIDLSMYAQCRPRLGGHCWLLRRNGILVVHPEHRACPAG
jgi:nicotinamidase-related amidase